MGLLKCSSIGAEALEDGPFAPPAPQPKMTLAHLLFDRKYSSSLKTIWYDFFGSSIEVAAGPNMPLHKFMKAAERARLGKILALLSCLLAPAKHHDLV